MRKKNVKKLVIIAIGIAAVLFAITRLNIQSVSEYRNEGRELSRQLQPSETTQVEQRETAVSESGIKTVEKKKSSLRKQKKEKKPSVRAVKKKKKHPSKKTPRASSAPREKPTATPSATPYRVNCTIEIRCDSLLENRDRLDGAILSVIPEDGILLARTKVTLKKKSSVYDVLSLVCKAEGIALDAEYTPMYESYYIRGIGNLYEQQAGDMSGWLYTVNGSKPDQGASAYIVSEGDNIVWGYTCDGRTL